MQKLKADNLYPLDLKFSLSRNTSKRHADFKGLKFQKIIEKIIRS